VGHRESGYSSRSPPCSRRPSCVGYPLQILFRSSFAPSDLRDRPFRLFHVLGDKVSYQFCSITLFPATIHLKGDPHLAEGSHSLGSCSLVSRLVFSPSCSLSWENRTFFILFLTSVPSFPLRGCFPITQDLFYFLPLLLLLSLYFI